MAKNSAKAAAEAIPVAKYYTGDALESMRGTGDLRGWFGYAVRGRKAKQSEVPKLQDSNTKAQSTHHGARDGSKEGTGGSKSRVIDSNTPNGAAVSSISPDGAGKTNVRRGKYTDWSHPDQFDRLKAAVVASFNSNGATLDTATAATATGAAIRQAGLDHGVKNRGLYIDL